MGNIICAEGARRSSVCPIIHKVLWDVDHAMTTHPSIDGLRPRRCGDPTCNAMFALCRGCDRGQRYCSDACRKRMRLRQVRTAGRRYQASAVGKLKHGQRQQAYRQRQCRPRVTHQGPVSITTSQPTGSASLARCVLCGQGNRWINPFHWLPQPRRRSRQDRKPANRPNFYVST
jgi:hypothetical protein